MDSSVNVRKEDQVKVLGILSKMLNNNESINFIARIQSGEQTCEIRRKEKQDKFVFEVIIPKDDNLKEKQEFKVYEDKLEEMEPEEETQAEADIAASEKCECYDARHERNLRKQITAAQNRIRKIFGDDAAKLGFSPIAAEEPLQLLNAIAEQTARGFITSATINMRGLCKAKITMTTKEKIKVERSETKTYQLEE